MFDSARLKLHDYPKLREFLISVKLSIQNPAKIIRQLNFIINIPRARKKNIIFHEPNFLFLDLFNNTKIELIYITSGEFMMGSPEEEIGYGSFHRKHFGCSRPKDEAPLHKVKIPTGFYLGEYEVTNLQYR